MSEEAIARSARWVQQESEIAELAALVVDPAREKLIVCVTKQPALDQPMLDPDAIAAELGDRADVWVVTEPGDAWALTEALPPKIDVYGGAVRAWAPIPEGKEPFPSDHPQWTVFSPDDAPRVLEQILAFVNLSDNPPPEFGTEATATVTAVRKAGAELTLDTGHPAFASNQHLVQHGEVYHAGEILQPGQQVRVRVGPWHAQAAKVSVSLRDFAPEPWERLGEVYEVDDIVDGVVIRLQPYGAFIELLPGAEGLLHLSKISSDYVEYVEDYLAPGDRVTVRLLSLDPYNRKAEMSIVDVPEGATPLPPASIYEGGPSWLPDSPDGFAEDPAPEPAGFHQERKRDERAGGQDDDSADRAADAATSGPGKAATGAATTDAPAPEVDPGELERLRAQVAELEQQLVALEEERSALAGQLAALTSGEVTPEHGAQAVDAAPAPSSDSAPDSAEAPSESTDAVSEPSGSAPEPTDAPPAQLELGTDPVETPEPGPTDADPS